ncbi:2-acylglycerol O-acyltransferase 2-A [Echinococcus granulosus]|uniref:Acyltransferase n=1 Tax=Echinococcus granulosus TaxID=6210 RepID=W6URF9_ECHGR|nr:2-acylglycerol O-acyltransferase 2-A [Echinococcus granulosus]EUB63276.1 2-acylglycerol O-acyltransferase 2-A [Echinococcus granulosus]
MAKEMGWYDHSVFYRFRARVSVFLFGCSIVLLPILCLIYYTRLFVYPLFLMTFGHPIADAYSCYCFLVFLLYTIHWIWDVETPYRGGRRVMWITRLALWKWVTQYFPARLVVSKELERWAREQGQEVGEEGAAIQLPTSVNYLLGYHPHGPVAMGMLMAYGNDLLNFSKVFPDIKTHIATLNVHYKVPFYREYAMLGGGVSVSQESLIYLLDKEVTGRTGNLVAVSVGGAIEALESRPGHYVLMLSRRRGFFRIALRTGAYLIPSIGFGETSMYDQVANPTGSALRKLQDWFTHTFTLAPPLFYSTRVIPYRKPLTVVVGRPIICRRVPHPTDEEIDNLREQYKQQLREIFNRYRPLYDPTAEDIRFY